MKFAEHVETRLLSSVTSPTSQTASLYKETIEQLFHYNINDDVSGIHPPNLCDTCRKKLDNATKSKHSTCDALPIFMPMQTLIVVFVICQPYAKKDSKLQNS